MDQGFLFSVVLPLIYLLGIMWIIPRAMKFLLYLSSALLFGRTSPPVITFSRMVTISPCAVVFYSCSTDTWFMAIVYRWLNIVPMSFCWYLEKMNTESGKQRQKGNSFVWSSTKKGRNFKNSHEKCTRLDTIFQAQNINSS